MVGAFGIARTVDAGFATKGVDFQSRVIGEAAHVVVVNNVLCFLQGVLLQCVVILWNILMTANVAQRENLMLLAENLPNLIQLVLVVGCKYYFHFSVLIFNSLPFPSGRGRG